MNTDNFNTQFAPNVSYNISNTTLAELVPFTTQSTYGIDNSAFEELSEYINKHPDITRDALLMQSNNALAQKTMSCRPLIGLFIGNLISQIHNSRTVMNYGAYRMNLAPMKAQQYNSQQRWLWDYSYNTKESCKAYNINTNHKHLECATSYIPSQGNGKGITIAVIDTGVDASHPDLRDNIIQQIDTTEEKNNIDGAGHGTHVTGTICGNSENFKGMAPEAKIISIKVLNRNGSGSMGAIVNGMEELISINKKRIAAKEPVIDLANFSLGASEEFKWEVDSYGGAVPMGYIDHSTSSHKRDPKLDAISGTFKTLSSLFSTLSAQGTMSFCAAGNSGAARGKFNAYLGYPGGLSSTIAIASYSLDDIEKPAPFSSHGSVFGRPNFASSGERIFATYPLHLHDDSSQGTGYALLSGTSMATPSAVGYIAACFSALGRAQLNRLSYTDKLIFLNRMTLPHKRFTGHLDKDLGRGCFNSFNGNLPDPEFLDHYLSGIQEK